MQSTLTQKDADLCLKPQGLLATRIYASSHAYIRVGLHVRTHRVTRTYAYAYTYIGISDGVAVLSARHYVVFDIFLHL